jgi:tetratricopeptide (TPR) repeat protein
MERARLLEACGSTDEALAALDALLAEDPGHVPALILKAGVLIETREAGPALPLCERAASLAPRSAEAANALARCLHALGKNEEALSAAERARLLLREDGNGLFAGPVYLTLLWCLRALRRYREALAVAREGLDRTPDAILAHWASEVEDEMAQSQRERC